MQKYLFLAAVLLALSCQKEEDPQIDLCNGIICNNGGYCVNGECDCPPRFTGPSCSQEVPPIKMKVDNIILRTFPPTDANGGGWDVFDGPDIYIAISKNGTYLYTSPFYENATGSLTWEVNFEFSDPTATYNISVWDYDYGLTTDDLLGGINFTPYRPGQFFPLLYSVNCSGCPVSFDFLSLSYFH